MKSIRSLIMILIGMISFTALATTPVREQKQNPVVSVEFAQSLTAVVVENYTVEFDAVSSSTFSMANDVQIFVKEPIFNNRALISDVGWIASLTNKNNLYCRQSISSKPEIYIINKQPIKTMPRNKNEIRFNYVLLTEEINRIIIFNNHYWSLKDKDEKI